ncbi:MAG: thermonuclease family protein [Paludibacteraceae bacterium]|nr:thermonuclease family protein [Paludibacteraceae bacterium]
MKYHCKKIILGLYVVLLSLSSCNTNPAQRFAKDGTQIDYDVYVVKIIDGDTFDGLYKPDNQVYRYRLQGVDAPEKGQPYGKKAKQYLADLILNKNIGIVEINEDAYGRYVAKIYDEDGNDLCAEMIRAGMAHHFRRYDDSKYYEQLEIEARENRVGLWNYHDVIEPRIWRKMSKAERDLHR